MADPYSSQQLSPDQLAQLSSTMAMLKQRQATQYPGQTGQWGYTGGNWTFTPRQGSTLVPLGGASASGGGGGTGGIDWSKIASTALTTIPQLFNTSGTSGGFNLLSPQGLTGAGLLAAGALNDKEPGEVTEARQFLRNQFTSPTASTDILKRNVTGTQDALKPLYGDVGPSGVGQQFMTDQLNPGTIANRFSSQISALSDQYQPLLTQQRQRGMDDIQQRFAAAFPTSGAQGSEFASLGRYLTDEALPREQAVLGDIGRELLTRQENAANQLYADEQGRRNTIGSTAGGLLSKQMDSAGTILNTSKPDQMSELMTMLGYDMLSRSGQTASGGSMLGSWTGTGTGAGGQMQGIQDILGQLGGSVGTMTTGPGFDMAKAIIGSGGLNSATAQQIAASLGTTLGFDAAMAGGGLSGITAMTSQGIAIPIEAISGAGGAAGAAGGTGGAGAAMSALSAAAVPAAVAAAAVAAMYGGYKIGENNPKLADAPGWAKALGILATGGFGGAVLFGANKAQKAQKAEFLSQDLDSQRDQVFEIGNIGATFLQELGATQEQMNAWESFVNNEAANSAGPGDEQGRAATRLGETIAQIAGKTGNQISGLRQRFVDYLVQNTFTAGNSSYGGGAPRNFIDSWAGMAQLAKGGYLPRGGPAIVGEAGKPELLLAGPGTMVIPMRDR